MIRSNTQLLLNVLESVGRPIDLLRGKAVLYCTLVLSTLFAGVILLAAIPHAVATLCNLSSQSKTQLLKRQNACQRWAHRLGEAPIVVTFYIAVEIFNIQAGPDIENTSHKKSVTFIVYAVLIAFVFSLQSHFGYLALVGLCALVLLHFGLLYSIILPSPIILCTVALAFTYWLQMYRHIQFLDVHKPTDRIPMLAGISLIALVRNVSNDVDAPSPTIVVSSCYLATSGLIVSELFWESPTIHKTGLGLSYVGAWCIIFSTLFLDDDSHGFDGPLPHVTWCSIILALQYLLVHTFYWIREFTPNTKLFLHEATATDLEQRQVLMVQRLNGEHLAVDFDADDNVSNVKSKIHAELGIPVARQCLMLGTTILEDHCMLRETGVSKESHISLVILSEVDDPASIIVEDIDDSMANLSFLLGGEAEVQISMHGFKLGDRVTWNNNDNDVPHGEVGAVVGFTHNRVRVEFNRGVWTFEPTEVEKADLEEGQANSSTADLRAEDARASVFLCPMLVAVFLVTQVRALELANFLGTPQYWAIILMHVCCWSLLLQLALCLLSRSAGWYWLRWLRLLCLLLSCSSVVLVVASSLILHKSDALWEHPGARLQPDIHALTVEKYPPLSSCKLDGVSQGHTLCDPEGQLTSKEQDQIRDVLKSFDHPVSCKGRSVHFHVGVLVAKTFGADFNILAGESIFAQKADEMMSRLKEQGLWDEGCENGAIILAFTDVRYLAFRAGGCNYISTIGSERTSQAMLGSVPGANSLGERLSAGVNKLSEVLDSPSMSPCLGCAARGELEGLFFVLVVVALMASVDIYRKRQGQQPIFFTGRRGNGGYMGGGFGGFGGGGFY